jgi:hypothetical protein
VFGRARAGIYQSKCNKESAAYSIHKWTSTIGRERAHAPSTAIQRRPFVDASYATTRADDARTNDARVDDARTTTTTAGLRGSSNANTVAATSRWSATNAGRPKSTALVGKPGPLDGDAATGHATSSTIQTQPSRFAHASPFAWVLGSLYFFLFLFFKY